jgi:hypothetical protein
LLRRATGDGEQPQKREIQNRTYRFGLRITAQLNPNSYVIRISGEIYAAGKPEGAGQSGAESVAAKGGASQVLPLAGELQEFINAWAGLPIAIKAGIVAMIRASRA